MTAMENVLVYANDHPGEKLARVFTAPQRVRTEAERITSPSSRSGSRRSCDCFS
jgi:hypothetical protein